MNKTVQKRNIDTVFVLIIFSVFAISVLLVLMLGASVYRNINETSRDGADEKTALSYIWTKTKNFDNSGGVSVGVFNGVPALFISETLGGVEYQTVIYHYDGWLCELFSEASLEFSLADGVRVIQVDEISFEAFYYGLIQIKTGDNILLLYSRSGSIIQNRH